MPPQYSFLVLVHPHRIPSQLCRLDFTGLCLFCSLFRLLSLQFTQMGFSVNRDKPFVWHLCLSTCERAARTHPSCTYSKEPNFRVQVLSFLCSRSLEELLLIIHTPKGSYKRYVTTFTIIFWHIIFLISRMCLKGLGVEVIARGILARFLKLDATAPGRSQSPDFYSN